MFLCICLCMSLVVYRISPPTHAFFSLLQTLLFPQQNILGSVYVIVTCMPPLYSTQRFLTLYSYPLTLHSTPLTLHCTLLHSHGTSSPHTVHPHPAKHSFIPHSTPSLHTVLPHHTQHSFITHSILIHTPLTINSFYAPPHARTSPTPLPHPA